MPSPQLVYRRHDLGALLHRRNELRPSRTQIRPPAATARFHHPVAEQVLAQLRHVVACRRFPSGVHDAYFTNDTYRLHCI